MLMKDNLEKKYDWYTPRLIFLRIHQEQMRFKYFILLIRKSSVFTRCFCLNNSLWESPMCMGGHKESFTLWHSHSFCSGSPVMTVCFPGLGKSSLSQL